MCVDNKNPMSDPMLQVYKVHAPKGSRDGKLELIAVKHDVHGLSPWHEIAQQVLHQGHPSHLMAYYVSCCETVGNNLWSLHDTVSIDNKLLPDL